MSHVPPAGTDAGQLVVKAKSPFTVMEEIASAPGPALVSVVVCAALVVETVLAENVSEDGVRVIVGLVTRGVMVASRPVASPK